MSTISRLLFGTGLGAAAGYMVAQQIWVRRYLARQDVAQVLAGSQNRVSNGLTFEVHTATEIYTVRHFVEDGIERIHYKPLSPRFDTPLLFIHGMWHGAWCWRFWQELFATWGWESVSFSLPGHAKSLEQRPLRLCTLDYYLAFVKDEVMRLSRRPVLCGHSMGGALAQWYLKHVGEDLPAVVLLAPWPRQASVWDGLRAFLPNDPLGLLLVLFAWSAAPLMRSPQSAARLLISAQAPITPEALHAQVGPESIVVMLQHLKRFWTPLGKLTIPMLLIAGGVDTMTPVGILRQSAEQYGADFYLAPRAGHNVQMDSDYQETAETITQWLESRGIV